MPPSLVDKRQSGLRGSEATFRQQQEDFLNPLISRPRTKKDLKK
jgi:hypothetical protein